MVRKVEVMTHRGVKSFGVYRRSIAYKRFFRVFSLSGILNTANPVRDKINDIR